MRPGGGDANARYCPSSKMDSAPETRPKMTTDLCFRNATELAAGIRMTCGSPIHRYNLPVQSK